MALRLFNTRTSVIEDFVAAAPPAVSMYICGATVYAPAHIGHGRSYVVFDTLRRLLRFHGYAVDFVQNFTDVAEEISLRAVDEHVDALTFAEHYIEEFWSDMDRLAILRARAYPRVSEYIDGIVASIQALLDSDGAYVLGDSIYFDSQKAGGFGDLSHQRLEDMIAGGTGDGEGRRHPLDFALWKPAKPPEASWPAPWGEGRPGWHIECTVMSGALQSRPLDIHGGGIDLIYPHHESEILIARAETHTELARYYLHHQLVTHRLQKMSKSRANYVTLGEMFEVYEPEVVRFALLSHHYREAMECCDEGFDDAERDLDTLRRAMALVGAPVAPLAPPPAGDTTSHLARVIAALDDDLDTPTALEAAVALAEQITTHPQDAPDDTTRADAAAVFAVLHEVCGLASLAATVPA